jgi:hypothetical protein
MKKLPLLLLLVAALAACTKQESAIKTPSVTGLDLSQVQSVDYFRANLSGAKELSAWCAQNVNPADTSSDEKAVRNLKNCKNSEFALRMPVVDIRQGKTYKQY